ncbi:MAG: enoyl-CoA hydratase [Pseudonocardiales bacterium]|nr:enoyl-CoA hydratase [Pseudonocardiales bacterium]
MTEALNVRLDFEGAIASLSLNRPDAGNAINQAMADELRAAVVEIGRRPDCGLVVLSSAGKAFCVGGDVREMAAASDRGEMLTALAGAVHEALVALRSLPVTIVAAVQGAVAGAGLGLVLAADLVVCADNATFRTAYAAIGLSPDCGVSALLPGVVGQRRAAELTLNGRVLDAQEALDWTLVTEVCPIDDLGARASELAASIAGRAPKAIGEAARLLRAAPGRGYSDQLDDEGATIARLGRGSESAELIDAFVNRPRNPRP